ncbi:MAG: hypothetical protein H7X95_11920, partial [Deltaproteobacteria bacterium]|nr:hypothetical protein [Deltaproteobacteria bacterium]
MHCVPSASRDLAALLAAVTLALTCAATGGCRRPIGQPKTTDGAAATGPLSSIDARMVPPVAQASTDTDSSAVADPLSPSRASVTSSQRAHHKLPKIDVHMHIGPDSIERTVALMDKWGITGVVNLSG